MSEPTPIDLPVGLRWVKLVCRLGRLVTDSTADADAHPDLLPVGGTLTLTASPSRVRIQEADGRWRSVEVAGCTYTIRADGELVDNEGRVGVYIPDPASLLVEPQGYAITAAVKPTGGTDWRVTVAGSTVLPDVVDLVAVSSVGSVSPSVTASLDARIYSLEQGGGVDVSQAVEDYLTANPPAAGLDTEAAQDVVGAMIVGAGGTYDDDAGTITLPSGSGAAAMVESVNTLASATGTVGLPSIAVATVHDITLAGSVTISLPTGLPAGACSMTVILRQDATGARAVTWPTNVAWPNAVAPVASTDPGSVTVVALWTVDSGSTWFGALSAANMIPAAPATPTAPGAPVLTASGDSDSITLTWEPAPANGSPVTTYKVWRGTSAGSLSLLTTTTGTTFAHDDTTVTVGTLYYYAVSAVNAVGEGPTSAIQSTMAQSEGTLTLFAADDFNRPDAPVSAQLGPGQPASWAALAWEGPSLTSCGVHNNTLVAGPNTGAARIYIEAGTANVAVEATFLRSGSGFGIRYGTGSHDYYRIGVTSANRMFVYEHSGSSTPANVLLPDNNTTTNIQFGDLVRAEAFGTTIKVLVNGVEQFSFEDAIKNTNTKHGFAVTGNQPTTPAHDDWKLYK